MSPDTGGPAKTSRFTLMCMPTSISPGAWPKNNPGDPTAPGENHSGSGILLESVDGGVVEYCETTGNGALNRSRHGGPVGIWCTLDDIAIQYWESDHNQTSGQHDGGGFCLDGGVCNSVLQYNLSESNDGSGFGLYHIRRAAGGR